MRAGFQSRIVAPVMLVTVLAVALAAFLNYGKFVRTYSAIEESRFAFVADDIRSVIEGGLDLGVPLAELVAAQPMIEREAAKDPQIVGIALFDEGGRMVFRTGDSGETAPAAWLTALRASDGRWADDSGATLVAGARLSNDSRQLVGGIAVLYSRQVHEALTARVARSLAFGGIASAAAAAVLAHLGVSLLLRRLRREVGGLRTALEGGEGFPAPEPAEARKAAEQAVSEIDATAAEIERLAGGGGRP